MPPVARPAAAPTAYRRPVRRPTPEKPAPQRPRSFSMRHPAVFGTAIGGAVALGVLVLYLFGAARSVTVQPRTGIEAGVGGGGGGRQDVTTMYRDTRDGRVIVMEVDAKGTRIKGTMAKEDVPLANDTYRDDTPRRSADAPTTTDRVNALGSSFR